MKLLGDVGHVESCFGPLRDYVSAGEIKVQDRSMICVKGTIGSEVILDAPNGTPR
jgi:hypothetical protein